MYGVFPCSSIQVVVSFFSLIRSLVDTTFAAFFVCSPLQFLVFMWCSIFWVYEKRVNTLYQKSYELKATKKKIERGEQEKKDKKVEGKKTDILFNLYIVYFGEKKRLKQGAISFTLFSLKSRHINPQWNTKPFRFHCESRNLFCNHNNGDLFTCEDKCIFSR